MKLTFLGTATSTGIPVLGCRCDVCLSGDSRDIRLRCAALLTTEDHRNILIDCGPDIRYQLLRQRVTDIDTVLITHSHYDHVGGLDDLRTLSYARPIDIYCTADVAADIRRQLPYCFTESNYPNIPRLNLRIIEPDIPFQLFDLTIQPFTVIHGRLPITGYRIGRFAYITDASVVPESAINILGGLDVLIINALRIKPNPTHMNLDEALDVIKTVHPRNAYLIHMSHQMGRHADMSPVLPPDVRFAYDGLTLEFE